MQGRLAAAALAAVFLLTPAAAQPSTPVEAAPGLITAGSPLYQADLWLDTVQVTFTNRTMGDVAYERASEYAVARENGNPDAANRSLQRLTAVAQTATNQSHTGLDKASAVLEQVREETPDEADQGLSTALDQIEEAKQRKPPTPQDGKPSEKSPDVKGGGV